MSIHSRPLLLGLTALAALLLPQTGLDPSPPGIAVASATEVRSPALTTTNFKQEKVTLACTKAGTNPDFWTCYGTSSATRTAVTLLVTHLNCFAWGGGTLSRGKINMVRLNTNGYDDVTFPMTPSFASSGANNGLSVNTMLEYLVPAGDKIRFDANVVGTNTTSLHGSCTYTGRLVTP